MHDENSDSFDENQCCVCFWTYANDVVEDTGLDWQQCVGKRWSALIMTQSMMLMVMIYCVHFAVFDCVVVYCDVYINSDFVKIPWLQAKQLT